MRTGHAWLVWVPIRSPHLLELSHKRLYFVSGKGGTGKTAVSVGLARALARLGRRVLILEVDAPRPNLPSYFGGTIDSTPRQVATRIEGANIDFFSALRSYVESVVPVRRVVGLILRNKVVRIFLTATPGARELVLLSRVWEYSWDPRWDHVIVDLPASGHTLALFRCPGLAARAFGRGPLRRRADEIIERFSDPEVCRMVFCALPGEMPINETLETARKIKEIGLPPVAGVLLNRYPDETFGPDEQRLLDQLNEALAPARDPGVAGDTDQVLVRAAVEAALETRRNQAVAEEGLDRLRVEFGEDSGTLPILPGTHAQVADAISLCMSEWTL